MSFFIRGKNRLDCLDRVFLKKHKRKIIKGLDWLYNIIHLRFFTPVLVYQMGKVGSTSVYKSILSCRCRAVHIHKMRKGYMHEIRKKREILIITPIREPFSHRISGFFENFDIHTGINRPPQSMNIDTLRDLFFQNKNLWKPAPWLDNEMRNKLDVDVFQYPFPREKGWSVIEKGNLRILLFKIELEDDVVEQIIAEFIQKPMFKLMRFNETRGKAYAEQYDTFKNTVSFPESFVDSIYQSKFARHFYSESELDEFRSKLNISKEPILA